MADRVWMNGAPVSRARARVPVTERAFRYGDGVFVTIGVVDGVLLDAAAQLERLRTAARAIALELPAAVQTTEEFVTILRDLGLGGRSDPYVVRVQVSAGPSRRGYGRPESGNAWELVETLQAPAARRCRAAIATPDAPLPPPALPAVKSCNALAHVLAAREARRIGVDEIVRLSGRAVTEAASANLFWLEDEGLRTPAATLPLYPGVTRSVVLDVARSRGFAVEEGEYSPAALAGAASAFLTNAARGIERVAELHDRPLRWPDEIEQLARAVHAARIERGVRV